ncbi:hypothetical protein [Cellulomonas sp. NS3]|uniref:hypothetical protein n=1 Tax=Cellulomonas sp. NS3 TaxID=2973977 RepID=UPI002161F115|nr:hypothetical protein [Cellulomonas sp. NS3]
MEITLFLVFVGAVVLVSVIGAAVSRGNRTGGSRRRSGWATRDATWVGGAGAGAWYGTSGDSSSGWGGGDFGGGGMGGGGDGGGAGC